MMVILIEITVENRLKCVVTLLLCLEMILCFYILCGYTIFPFSIESMFLIHVSRLPFTLIMKL
jgi:hypothetical protein